ncbi:MAG: DUF1499 domain-containing protein, partial [Acidobacteria bacterium]|nr:DUF1499 domain-containing protein [Acidobacteriota bacterium]
MEPRLRWLADGAVAVAALAALVLVGSAVGARLGLWAPRAAFGALRFSALLAMLGAALSAIALVGARLAGGEAAGAALRHGGAPVAGALLLSLAVFAVPWLTMQQARKVPYIHDITTDTADPPAFVAVLPLRAGAPNSAVYGGPEVAAAQARAYPDLGPRHLAVPPAVAFEQALAAARAMGWTIVAAEPAAGRIEATATTRWLAFKDDVVVRIRPDAAGSRVDVRSVSRVGK